jgi:hypothetical protein
MYLVSLNLVYSLVFVQVRKYKLNEILNRAS